MPQIFKFGPYTVYFWSDEGDPLEPIHVHIAEGKSGKDATKIWITSAGKTLLCHNKSEISFSDLRKLMRAIEANVTEVINAWYQFFGEIRYYC